jgi:nucleoside-diphosphate-sugar epimerase
MREASVCLLMRLVLPNATFGKPLDPEIQGYPSSSAWPKMLFEGDYANFAFLVKLVPPRMLTHLKPLLAVSNASAEYFIDVEDVARFHVIALIHPELSRQRIFACAATYNYNDILAIFRKNFPDRKFLVDWPGLGKELTIVPPREKANALLKEFGRPGGFTPFEESILRNVEGA